MCVAFFGVARLRSWVLLAVPLVALSTVSGGCDLINPDEPVPAYLRIAPFTFTGGVSGAPASPDQVKSTYVYADNRLLGIFELPAKVPVLASGQTAIRLAPAIIPDGQRATRVAYPFYTSTRLTPTLVPGETLELAPTTGFDPATLDSPPFPVSEDFAPGGVSRFSLATSGSGSTALNFATGVDDGGRPEVGRVRNDGGTTDIFWLEGGWLGAGQVPQGGKAVYLELDYRCSMPFRVGVKYRLGSVGDGTESADLTVYPQESWTKLYVNLTEEVSRVNNASAEYKVFIKGLPNGVVGEYLSLDNVRLVVPK